MFTSLYSSTNPTNYPPNKKHLPAPSSRPSLESASCFIYYTQYLSLLYSNLLSNLYSNLIFCFNNITELTQQTVPLHHHKSKNRKQNHCNSSADKTVWHLGKSMLKIIATTGSRTNNRCIRIKTNMTTKNTSRKYCCNS